MNSISKTYTLKFELDFAPEYQWTSCGKCFNVKTGRQIKQTYVSGSIGYCIRGKFNSLTKLRQHLQKIKKVSCPF
jgi:hypothetical protein